MSQIVLVPLQFSRISYLEGILGILERRFKRPTRLEIHPMDLTSSFDPARSQYDANWIINQLLDLGKGDDKVLGVTDLDIFIPVLTFIFGQAYLGGKGALVSGHRLENHRYGMPPDEDVYEQRLLKCILHELGHTFDLRHCQTPSCLMVSSSYVEEMDQKGEQFCSSCSSLLKSGVL